MTAATPPTLLVHTQADASVPVENSILFYQALTRAGVPAEMLSTASLWPRRVEEWLGGRGLLAPAG